MKINLKELSRRTRIILGAVILLIAAIVAISVINSRNKPAEETAAPAAKVKTLTISAENNPEALVEGIGTVKAASQVDVIAVAGGTLRQLHFHVGDQVLSGALLASLYDSNILTSLNNANTNYVNTQSNLVATERLTDESLRQAETGIQSAKEQVNAAQIGVEAAKDSLASAMTLKSKSNLDAKNSAVISVNSHLNTIFSALDQIALQLNIDSNGNASPDPGLGVKDVTSVQNAVALYRQSQAAYDKLAGATVNTDNIIETMTQVNSALSATEQTVSSVITVLDKSVSSQSLTEAYLNAQKSAFIGLRSNIVSVQSGAKATLQALQNQDLVYDSDIEGLENALASAQNRLDSAQLGLQNAQNSYQNAIKAKESQLIATKSQVDSARGQLNLAQTQAGYLTVTSPITGQITKKYVEPGMEINPGMPIAQVSQTEAKIVEMDLPIEDINKIGLGQSVRITLDPKEYEGIINRIDPIADPVSRKVHLEILVTNPDDDLFIGSFAEVRAANKNLNLTGESFYIPLQYLIITQNEQYVYVVRDGQVSKKAVTLGQTAGKLVEVTSGLELGDEMITEGAKLVEEGEIVEVIQ